MHVQRRASVLMAIQNRIRKINITHQINVRAKEEIIDVAAVIRPSVRTSTCSYPDMSDTDVMPFCMRFHYFPSTLLCCFVVINQF